MSGESKTSFEKELYISKYFPYPTYGEWKIEAERLLKGAPFDKVLMTDTYEGITLKAIYDASDIQDIPYLDNMPGTFPYVRGTDSAQKVVNGWDIQQEFQADSLEQWNQQLLNDLQKGQNSFRLKHNISSYDDLCKALKNISLEHISFDIEAGGNSLAVFDLICQYCDEFKIDMTKLSGSISGDAFADNNHSKILDDIASTTKKVIENKLSLKTISIDLSAWNDLGSSATQDIGIMASMVDYYVENLSQKGLTPDEIFAQMTFIFAVSNNLFMEIAKLRVARLIFSKLAEAYGVKPENAKMRMHVRTSNYTKTVFDPWVNILRTTTEAFSAIVGGCDSLHITPFDCAIGEADEFSMRITRNQQLILLEESHLNAVNDPAGGSYYVEAITYELLKKGWELFLEINDNGGYLACKDTLITSKVNETHLLRLKNAETRKDTIVGTSTFANLSEKKLDKNATKNSQKRRLSETFENLRNTVEAINPRPEVFVVNIGKVVKNKPRVDFAIGFFEPAGFICQTNDGFENVSEAIDAAVASPSPVIVLSSTDDQYPEVVPVFAQALKQKAPQKVLALAGYPKDHLENFTKAGVDFYVYMRCNVVKTIKEILAKGGLVK